MKKLMISIALSILFVNSVSAESICTQISKELKVGSKGEDVIKLQKFLVENKYLKTNIFGTFGPSTKTAVVKFQKASGINQSGYVDGKTIDIISKNSCSKTTAVSKTNSVNSLNIDYIGGQFVSLRDPKLCSFRDWTIDWGDTQKSFVSNITKYDCDKGFTHLYPNDGEYILNIIENQKVIFTQKVNILSDYTENGSIKFFDSKKLDNEVYILSWDSSKQKECKLINNSETKKVDLKGSSVVQNKKGAIYELKCIDLSDRESRAWAIIGDEKDYKSFMIKQFNFFTYKARAFLVWETNKNAISCSLDNNSHLPLNGGGELENLDYAEYTLSCYSTLSSESRKISFGAKLLYSKPMINNFGYKKIDDLNFMLNWDVDGAHNCYFSGGNFGSSLQKNFFENKNVSFQANLYNAPSYNVTIHCVNPQGLESSKEINLK